MKKRRVAILMHEDLVPPDSIEELTEAQIAPFRTEYDVCSNLRDLGHEVQCIGVSDDLGVLRAAVNRFKPHICFNLLEEFHGLGVYDAHVVSFLELIKQPYTGCNPRGLMLARDKALSKMICRYHRINVPGFAVFPVGRSVRPPRRLPYPLFVKSLTEEGSAGIAQASIVHNHEDLIARVQFIHRTLHTDAIAEQYIAGRELYVGVMGNQRLTTLPIWELRFHNLRDDAPRIATGKVKWDYKYQQKVGVETAPARDLPDGLDVAIPRLCKRIYRALSLSGYARIDLRLSEQGHVYLIEANPNPQLAYGEDFAESASAAAIHYPELLHRLLNLGFSYKLTGVG